MDFKKSQAEGSGEGLPIDPPALTSLTSPFTTVRIDTEIPGYPEFPVQAIIDYCIKSSKPVLYYFAIEYGEKTKKKHIQGWIDGKNSAAVLKWLKSHYSQYLVTDKGYYAFSKINTTFERMSRYVMKGTKLGDLPTYFSNYVTDSQVRDGNQIYWESKAKRGGESPDDEPVLKKRRLTSVYSQICKSLDERFTPMYKRTDESPDAYPNVQLKEVLRITHDHYDRATASSGFNITKKMAESLLMRYNANYLAECDREIERTLFNRRY